MWKKDIIYVLFELSVEKRHGYIDVGKCKCRILTADTTCRDFIKSLCFTYKFVISNTTEARRKHWIDTYLRRTNSPTPGKNHARTHTPGHLLNAFSTAILSLILMAQIGLTYSATRESFFRSPPPAILLSVTFPTPSCGFQKEPSCLVRSCLRCPTRSSDFLTKSNCAGTTEERKRVHACARARGRTENEAGRSDREKGRTWERMRDFYWQCAARSHEHERGRRGGWGDDIDAEN